MADKRMQGRVGLRGLGFARSRSKSSASHSRRCVSDEGRGPNEVLVAFDDLGSCWVTRRFENSVVSGCADGNLCEAQMGEKVAIRYPQWSVQSLDSTHERETAP